MLLGLGLERPVPKFGARVDKLELNLFQVPPARGHLETLADRNNTLLGPGNGPLEHEKVVLDNPIVREPPEWRDLLVGGVRFSARIGRIGTRPNPVDLLVHLRPMVVSICHLRHPRTPRLIEALTLASARNREHDLAWMPRSDTSNLAQSLVGLARQLLGAPPRSHTLKAVTLGDRNYVDNLVLLKHSRHFDRLLEQTVGKSDLVRDTSAVDLHIVSKH